MLATLGANSVHAGDGLEVFAADYSIDPGDDIQLYVSLPNNAPANAVYQIEAFTQDYSGYTSVGQDGQKPPNSTLTGQHVDESLFTPTTDLTGALGWPTATLHTLQTDTRKSGVYQVKVLMGLNNDDPAKVETFSTVILNKAAGTNNDILLIDTLLNSVGNSAYGGKSLFAYNSSNGEPAAEVAIHRPIGRMGRLQETAAWLDKNGYQYDVMSEEDLDTTAIPDSYKVVILTGRNQFFTLGMRQHLDDYVNNGGHLMILGAETMRFVASIQNGKLQAKTGDNADLWQGQANKENSSTGLTFSKGGFVNQAIDGGQAILPATDGNNGGYIVNNGQHWVYYGLGVNTGDVFGKSDNLINGVGATANIVGPSVDGMLVTKNGNTVTPNDPDAPLDYQIIAWAPAEAAGHQTGFYATPGIFRKGAGWVFNAATMNWSKGLAHLDSEYAEKDAVTAGITKNVLAAFRNGMTDLDQDNFPKGVDPDDNDPNIPGTGSTGGSGSSGSGGSGSGGSGGSGSGGAGSGGSGSGGSTGSGSGGSGSSGGSGTSGSGGGGGSTAPALLLGLATLGALRRRVFPRG